MFVSFVPGCIRSSGANEARHDIVVTTANAQTALMTLRAYGRPIAQWISLHWKYHGHVDAM
jgi:hypothetical protein